MVALVELEATADSPELEAPAGEPQLQERMAIWVMQAVADPEVLVEMAERVLTRPVSTTVAREAMAAPEALAAPAVLQDLARILQMADLEAMEELAEWQAMERPGQMDWTAQCFLRMGRLAKAAARGVMEAQVERPAWVESEAMGAAMVRMELMGMAEPEVLAGTEELVEPEVLEWTVPMECLLVSLALQVGMGATEPMVEPVETED